jgi:hypothetical protein
MFLIIAFKKSFRNVLLAFFLDFFAQEHTFLKHNLEIFLGIFLKCNLEIIIVLGSY